MRCQVSSRSERAWTALAARSPDLFPRSGAQTTSPPVPRRRRRYGDARRAFLSALGVLSNARGLSPKRLDPKSSCKHTYMHTPIDIPTSFIIGPGSTQQLTCRLSIPLLPFSRECGEMLPNCKRSLTSADSTNRRSICSIPWNEAVRTAQLHCMQGRSDLSAGVTVASAKALAAAGLECVGATDGGDKPVFRKFCRILQQRLQHYP